MVTPVTPKQLERKARQLHSRKRLVETVEELEQAIMTYMASEGKSRIHTENFIITLVEGTLEISIKPPIHLNQLTLDLKVNTKFETQGGHYQ